jgi:hypothetical protein
MKPLKKLEFVLIKFIIKYIYVMFFQFYILGRKNNYGKPG